MSGSGSDSSSISNKFKFIVTSGYCGCEIYQVTYNLEEFLGIISRHINEHFQFCVENEDPIEIKGHGEINNKEQLRKLNLFDLIQFSVRLGNVLVDHEYSVRIDNLIDQEYYVKEDHEYSDVIICVTMVDDEFNVYTWDTVHWPMKQEFDLCFDDYVSKWFRASI